MLLPEKFRGMLWAIPLILPSMAAPGPEIPRLALPLMQAAPTIDGAISEEEWSGAARMVGFVSQHNGALTARQGIFWVGCDGKSLFIALRTEAPPGGQILSRAVPDGDRDIMAALADDSIELWMDPHRGKTAGDRRYYQIITNARGAIFDRSYNPADPQNPVDMQWRVHWQFANRLQDGWWEVEIAIPLAELGAENDLDHPWGLRVVRNWQRPWDQSRWETSSAAFDDQPSMPVVLWDAQAPVTQVLALQEAQKQATIRVQVANPGATARPVRVFLQDAWSKNPPQELDKTLQLPPGTVEMVTLRSPDGGLEAGHRTLIRVTSPDGQRDFYVREFTWNLHRSEERWTLTQEEKQAVDLAFKYYPYYGKVRVKVNVESLASRDRVTGAIAQVRKAGTSKALAAAPLSFAQHAAEATFDVPDLPAGNYEVAVLLQGGEGVPKEAIAVPFERQHFPWEHNQLGLSKVVIPPFTPLQVKGKTISCILRDYVANSAGLWDRVVADGKEVLAAPMRWEVRHGGKLLAVQRGSWKVQGAKPHRVVTAATWQAGPLVAQVTSDYDYDGMAKVTLTFQAASGQRPAAIEGLVLIIPLRDSLMRYLHTCGDQLRYNYAGKTPAGDGVIWDSRQGNKTDIVGPFYPYVWLGDGARGLCWFADSDRDWVLDDRQPTLELARTGGRLELRVHFVTQRADLSRPRTIVFGLQATPVKPMPERPVNWRKWQVSKRFPGGVSLGILGSTYYYGQTGFDFYPRDKDFTIYEKIRKSRETGKVDEDWVKRWIAGYHLKEGTPEWIHYNNHIRYTFRDAPAYPRDALSFYVPYTNPRGISFNMEEWPTFQDEWVNFEAYPRSREGGLAYEITPTRSFQDCALFYYRQMMACFDGIYWDNVCLAANWDPVVGGAWQDEQGRRHPGMGLWALRELIRRTAVLFHEEGRPGAFVAHMTNTDIVPILSFANVSLDWEWRYGQTDFQDRFSPDLTVAETIGRKTGNVPLILAGGWYDSSAPNFNWVMRTRLGVMLVHELRVWDWQPSFEVELWGKLYEFGYGEEDCRVFNYWDEDLPVQVEGVEGKVLLLSRGRRAVVVVTDYGDGGPCRVKLEGPRLGLPAEAQAKDLESGAAVERVGTGLFAFPLNKHDFKAILVE